MPRRDLDAVGYVCEEFLLEGLTAAYRHAVPPTDDGLWEPEEIGEGAYLTRILVVRPADPARFNGTVLLEWRNVSAGFEMGRPDEDELVRGYAWVGVSAQAYGVHGGPAGGPGVAPPRGLVESDPERYATLDHPGDPGSFDIFGQAARAVGPHRNRSRDPLGGLDVQRVIATGGSQSAMRLVAYANGVHQLHQVIDGFVLTVWEGRAPMLPEGSRPVGMRTRLRSDLGVPTVIVNSEFEAMAGATTDLPDHELLRVWEVTGTPHGTRTRPSPPGSRGWRANPLSWSPVYQAALRAMHNWLTVGVAPAMQARIQLVGGSAKLARDDHGIAIGGVRLPEVAAPIGEYRGMSLGTGFGGVFGGFRTYDDATLAELYPSRDIYQQRWNEAIAGLTSSAALLPEDVPAYQQRGRIQAAALPVS